MPSVERVNLTLSDLSRAKRIAPPALLLVLWSSGAVAVSYGLEAVSPQLFLLIRAAGTATLAWVLVRTTAQSVPRGTELRRTIVAGLLLQVVYQGGFFLALDHGIGAGLVSIILSAQPLLTVVAARAASARSLAGVLIGMTGVAIAVGADLTSGGANATAVSFAVVALVAITAGTIAQSHAADAGVWACLAMQSTVSTAVYGIAVAVARPGSVRLSPSSIAAIGWVVVVISLGATALLYRLAHTRGAVTVSGLFLLVPAGAALEDFVIRGATLSPSVLLGGAVAAVGLALILPRNGAVASMAEPPAGPGGGVRLPLPERGTPSHHGV